MAVTARNLTPTEINQIILRTNEDTFIKLIPSISIYCVLSIVGTAGNIFSIYIFVCRMKSNLQNDLFILICVVNFLACGMCLPMEVVDMRYTYTMPSLVECKISRFLNVFTTTSCTFTLETLAILRLRASRSGTRVNVKRSRSIAGIVVLLLLSASISWLAAVVFGVRSSPTFVDDIMGADCSVADDVANSPWPMTFNAVLCIGFAILIALTTVAYYKIWRIVKKSRIAVTSHTVTATVAHSVRLVQSKELSLPYKGDDQIKELTEDRDENNIRQSCGEILQSQVSTKNFTKEVDDNIVTGSFSNKKTVSLVSFKKKRSKTDLHVTVAPGDAKGCSLSKQTHNITAVPCTTHRGKVSVNFKKAILENGSEVSAQKPTEEQDNFGSDKTDLRAENNPTPALALQPLCAETLAASSQKPASASFSSSNNQLITEAADSVAQAGARPSTSHQGKASKRPQFFQDKNVKTELKMKTPRRSLETAITRTVFLLTFTFILSYVPFFLVSVPRALDKNIDYSRDAVKLNLINSALRLYFIMPTVSPFIFWVSNLDFRRKCRALWPRDSSYVI